MQLVQCSAVQCSAVQCSACKGISPFSSVIQFIVLYSSIEMCRFMCSGACSVFGHFRPLFMA